MKRIEKYTIFIFLFTLICFISTPSHCSSFTLPDIKLGMNINTYSMFSNGTMGVGDDIDVAYPIGIVAGFSWDRPISECCSIMPEFYYVKDMLKRIVYTTSETILEQRIISHFLRIPFLIKYKIKWLGNFYLLGGFEGGYLLYANYRTYYPIEQTRNKRRITDDLSRFFVSANIGFGIYFSVRGILFSAELRYLFGFIENTHTVFGTWRINSVQFFVAV